MQNATFSIFYKSKFDPTYEFCLNVCISDGIGFLVVFNKQFTFLYIKNIQKCLQIDFKTVFKRHLHAKCNIFLTSANVTPLSNFVSICALMLKLVFLLFWTNNTPACIWIFTKMPSNWFLKCSINAFACKMQLFQFFTSPNLTQLMNFVWMCALVMELVF